MDGSESRSADPSNLSASAELIPLVYDELLSIHELPDRLAEIEPRKAEVAKLRYFVGMTVEEAAEALDIPPPTAKRDWTFARAWLFRELERER